MRRIMIAVMLVCVLAVPGLAGADYKKPSSARQEPAGTFEEAVDPSRYRKGNLEWDTQELIAGGFKALHEEQLQILEKLERIESRLNELEKSRGNPQRE